MVMAKGKVVITNRMNSANLAAKGQAASNNPPAPKPLGKTPGGPAKTAPKAPVTSAVADKVSGSKGAAAKNPGTDMGGGRKLGNHYSNC